MSNVISLVFYVFYDTIGNVVMVLSNRSFRKVMRKQDKGFYNIINKPCPNAFHDQALLVAKSESTSNTQIEYGY